MQAARSESFDAMLDEIENLSADRQEDQRSEAAAVGCEVYLNIYNMVSSLAKKQLSSGGQGVN